MLVIKYLINEHMYGKEGDSNTGLDQFIKAQNTVLNSTDR